MSFILEIEGGERNAYVYMLNGQFSPDVRDAMEFKTYREASRVVAMMTKVELRIAEIVENTPPVQLEEGPTA